MFTALIVATQCEGRTCNHVKKCEGAPAHADRAAPLTSNAEHLHTANLSTRLSVVPNRQTRPGRGLSVLHDSCEPKLPECPHALRIVHTEATRAHARTSVSAGAHGVVRIASWWRGHHTFAAIHTASTAADLGDFDSVPMVADCTIFATDIWLLTLAASAAAQ